MEGSAPPTAKSAEQPPSVKCNPPTAKTAENVDAGAGPVKREEPRGVGTVEIVDSATDSAAQSKKAHTQFYGELRMMMYGFGDVSTPLQPTVHLMEEIVIQYIVALVGKSMEVAHTRRRDKPNANDVKFVIKKDLKKLHRVRYLLELKAQIDKLKSLGIN